MADQKPIIIETALELDVKLVEVEGEKNGKPYKFAKLVISDGYSYDNPNYNKNLNSELKKISPTVSGYFLEDLKSYSKK